MSAGAAQTSPIAQTSEIAHSGGTNADGCHTNRTTGEYHCHGTPPPPTSDPNQLPTVISIGDGDTLRVVRNGEALTVRMACIDAPEIAQQPWGDQARSRLQQLLPVGQAVQLREVERDRYGRIVGEIFLGNQSVNLQMVREGHAVVYTQYLSACRDTRDQYLAAEASAKEQQLNFWSQENPVMPWDFRR